MNDAQSEIENLQKQLQNMDKLASLGMLSAGIAHEIQNPLNFVINFSKMSDRLVDDLADILEEEKDKLSDDAKEEIEDTICTLKENMKRIEEHGNRATSIIRGILLYSRGKEDEYIPTDVSKLVKEYVWLSYHAMRANDKSFNITIKEAYDSTMPLVNLVPQDFSRAVLNLVNNAIYALRQRSKREDPNYDPILTISVKKETDTFTVTVEDNGIGMTDEVKESLFKKFFTTKPIGDGTGLGLMITRSIIEEKHKGKIVFDSIENNFTRFTFIIPLNK